MYKDSLCIDQVLPSSFTLYLTSRYTLLLMHSVYTKLLNLNTFNQFSLERL